MGTSKKLVELKVNINLLTCPYYFGCMIQELAFKGFHSHLTSTRPHSVMHHLPNLPLQVRSYFSIAECIFLHISEGYKCTGCV